MGVLLSHHMPDMINGQESAHEYEERQGTYFRINRRMPFTTLTFQRHGHGYWTLGMSRTHGQNINTYMYIAHLFSNTACCLGATTGTVANTLKYSSVSLGVITNHNE